MGKGSEESKGRVVGEGSEGVGRVVREVGEGSEGVGEGSVEVKHGHVFEEGIEAGKDAYVITGESERGEGSVCGWGGGDGNGSEGVLEGRMGREVSMGGTTVHAIESERGEGSVEGEGSGGFEGRG